jgi:hypothetical protein
VVNTAYESGFIRKPKFQIKSFYMEMSKYIYDRFRKICLKSMILQKILGAICI